MILGYEGIQVDNSGHIYLQLELQTVRTNPTCGLGWHCLRHLATVKEVWDTFLTLQSFLSTTKSPLERLRTLLKRQATASQHSLGTQSWSSGIKGWEVGQGVHRDHH